MQKNWYIVYTKPKHEKKVTNLLKKRKIETFCPINCIRIQGFRHSKILEEPLFRSYVFINIANSEVFQIKHIDGVISLLYWMGKPAIIKEEEIEAIKEFTNDHQSIELEKAQVNVNDIISIRNDLAYSIESKVFSLKNKTVKIYLPSLGYVMVAKMEEESIFARETIILQNNSFSHL